MDISEGKSCGDGTEKASDGRNIGRFGNEPRAAVNDATYAAKATTFPRGDVGEKSIFIRHSDIPNAGNNMPTGEEMFLTFAKITDVPNILGIQKIGGLWRIYLREKESRITVISEGVKMRGVKIPVFDMNPFLNSGNENVWRVTVKDIPLSVADSVILHELEGMKCKVAGKIVRQKLRVNGQLTNCLNGDRVLYIEPRPTPLDRHVKIASFRARIFHDGQQKSASQATCSRCLATGHHASTCTKPFVCRSCNQPGHKSYQCTASRDQPDKERGATDRTSPGNNSETRHGSDTQPTPRSASVSERKSDTPNMTNRQTDSRRGKQESKTQQNLKDIWSRNEHAHNIATEPDSTESESPDESEYEDSNAFDSRQENVPKEQMKKKRKRRKKGSLQK